MDTNQSIRELVSRAQTGDREALGELFGEVRDRLEAAVLARLGTSLRGKVEVADILQETFFWATRSIDRFHWRGEDSFFLWLRGIANHMLLRAANQGKRVLSLELHQDVPASGTSPSKEMRRHDRFDRLEKALDGLSLEQREVIMLSRIEGLRVREIATRMNRSPNAVSLLLSRALKKMRASMGDTESLHLPNRTFKDESDDAGE